MAEGRYLYCVLPSDRPPPADVAGLEGRPVRRLEAEELALWASELAGRPSPSVERIRRHNEVVEAAMSEAATPLPMRFGQWFPDREALLSEAAGRAESWARALEEVRGAVEFAVRVLDPTREVVEPPPANAESGRAYMEGLARRRSEERSSEKRARRLVDELEAHLGPAARRQRWELLPADEGLVSVAHLVNRERTGAYRDRMSTFADDRGELRFRVSGPWPPYSFVEEADPG